MAPKYLAAGAAGAGTGPSDERSLASVEMTHAGRHCREMDWCKAYWGLRLTYI